MDIANWIIYIYIYIYIYIGIILSILIYLFICVFVLVYVIGFIGIYLVLYVHISLCVSVSLCVSLSFFLSLYVYIYIYKSRWSHISSTWMNKLLLDLKILFPSMGAFDHRLLAEAGKAPTYSVYVFEISQTMQFFAYLTFAYPSPVSTTVTTHDFFLCNRV